jgi:hypothetical protein
VEILGEVAEDFFRNGGRKIEGHVGPLLELWNAWDWLLGDAKMLNALTMQNRKIVIPYSTSCIKISFLQPKRRLSNSHQGVSKFLAIFEIILVTVYIDNIVLILVMHLLRIGFMAQPIPR